MAEKASLLTINLKAEQKTQASQDENPLLSFGRDSQYIDDIMDDIENGNGDLWKKEKYQELNEKNIYESPIENQRWSEHYQEEMDLGLTASPDTAKQYMDYKEEFAALVDAIPDSALKKVKEISDQLINGEISRGEAERKVREWVPVKFKSRTSELLSTCMAQSQKEKRGIVRPYETPAMINMKCGLNRLKSALGSVSEAMK